MLPETMPVCPVRGSVIYPTMVMPIDAGRPISIRAIDEALARDRVLLIVSQRDKEVETPRPSDLFEVGTACNILKMRKNPDGSVQVLVQAFARVRVREWLDLGDHPEARGEVLADEPGSPSWSRPWSGRSRTSSRPSSRRGSTWPRRWPSSS